MTLAQVVWITYGHPTQLATARLGDGRVKLAGGFGGWTEVERTEDVSATFWAGVGPIRMDVPIVFDKFASGGSVESEWNTIRSFGRQRDGGRPPILKVFGAVPFSGKRWVVEDLEEGDPERNTNGVLVRQPAVLHLMEYIDPTTVTIRKRRKHHKKKKHHKGKKHKSGSGK
jgi:hypothetical protein